MKLLLQLSLLLFSWFNLSATTAFSKVALPNHTVFFHKTTNQNQESEVKNGVCNFARSGILENSFSQNAMFWKKSVLENRAREANVGVVKGAGSLLDKALIAELKAAGVKFTEADLKFVAKNNDNLIMFLEKGNSNAGLQHIIERHWNADELMKFFNSQDEMIETLHNVIKNNSHVSKVVDAKNRLSYVYKCKQQKGCESLL